ncbi:MAG: EAL domain-containing protein [Rhizobiales bacterium]|nr:EAL domain-containing protein [Hyphomicrobiales bacterium]
MSFGLGTFVHGWFAEPEHGIFIIALGVSVALNLSLALATLHRQRAFANMRQAEQSFRDLYDNISEGVFRSTLDGRMISANPSLVRLNGYQTEAEMLRAVNNIGSEWYVDPSRRDEIHQILLDTGKATGLVSEIYRHNTRERIWIEESLRLVRDKRSGDPVHYEGTVREVTETVRRLELQDHYDKIASIVSGCLYQFRMRPDGATCLPYASIGLEHMFNLRPEQVIEDASALLALTHPDDVAHVRSSIEASRTTLTAWQCEYRVCLPDGILKWVFGHSVPEREADGSTLWHGYLTDISERKRTEATIHHLAYFDPLTRLPNRTMFRERLGQALSAGRENGQYGALLFIDLDHFKMLNDTKGHHVGDLLLSEIAGRIRACVRHTDLVARLGGDEFVVLLRELSSSSDAAAEQVKRIGHQVLAVIDRPFLAEDYEFQTTASIGVALFCCDDLDVDEVLKRADLAMYEAKSLGRGTLRFFQEEMQEVVEDRLALTSDLRRALVEGHFALAYQALVDRSGRWFGAEALLRWTHPTRGPIPPGEFIPLAERSGLMGAIDKWVLHAACATQREWQRDPATRDLRLSVNVSAHQLNRTGFVAAVEGALRETGADPSRLTLELTEHVMLNDIDDVSAALLHLKERGVSFALDDFGTGYSSLSYLKRLPIDTLKIDRSFVRDIESDPSDREIVQTILNIAASLEVSTIAEGVETEMQAVLLRQRGCKAFQGFLFAMPMPLDAFLAELQVNQLEAEQKFRRAQLVRPKGQAAVNFSRRIPPSEA